MFNEGLISKFIGKIELTSLHRLHFSISEFSLAFFFVFCLSSFSMAAPTSLTYQGRILKTDGTPLEYSNVSFIFQITDPSGQCVIYQEQINSINMANSDGVFDVPIGTATIQYPLSGTATVLDVFNNSNTYTCGSCSLTNGVYTCVNGSSSYAATANDIRKLRVSFYDGSGWRLITPDNTIRSVPFAAYSLSAQKLGPNSASDFLLKAGLPTCGAGTFLTWSGSALTCGAVSGASGGTVTAVTSSNSYLSVATGTSTPALTVNVGTIAGTLAAGDDSRITGAFQTSTSLGGDLSGTLPNPAVSKINGVSVSSAVAGDDGKFLKFVNGSGWQPHFVKLSELKNATGTASAFNVGTCTSAQTLVWSSLTDQFSCQDISLPASKVSGLATVATSGTYSDLTGTPTLNSLLPAQTGQNGKFLTTDGTNTSWAASSNQWTTSGSNIYYNAGNVGIGTTAPTGILDVEGGTAASGNGSGINLIAQNGIQSGGSYGGAITIVGGDGHYFGADNSGGQVSITAGSSAGGCCGVGTGASILLSGGSWANGGGPATISGGHGAGGQPGAPVTITGGNGSGYGNVFLAPNGGNVGIGTTSPAYPLDVQRTNTSTTGFPYVGKFSLTFTPSALSGTSPAALVGATNMSGTFSNNSTNGVSGVMGIVLNTGSGTITNGIATSGTTHVSSGTVTNAIGILGKVNNTGGTATNGHAGEFTVMNSGGTNTTGVGVYIGSISATTKHSLYASDATAPSYFAGAVGIGTTSPAAILDIVDTGTTSSAIIVPRAGAFTGTTVNGMVRYNSTSNLFEFYQNGSWVNYTTVSDARLKTNVVPVTSTQGLDIVNQLNPVFYDWNKNNPRTETFGVQHQVGFIAQEVEKVLPEVVNVGEDSYRSVEYGKIVSVVVAAVKELYNKLVGHDKQLANQARIIASVQTQASQKADKAEIEILKAENAALKARLERIEKMLQEK